MTDKKEALARFLAKLEAMRKAEEAYANEVHRLRELLRRCADYIGDLAEWNDAKGIELYRALEEFK